MAFSCRETSPLEARLKLKAIIVHKYHHISYELYLIYNITQLTRYSGPQTAINSSPLHNNNNYDNIQFLRNFRDLQK